MEAVFTEMKNSSEKTVSALKKDLEKIRTGRASLALLDSVKVTAYGAPTPLKQVASLSIPEPRLIVVQPWDVKMLAEIEKAIMKSDIGITPVNDGKILRLSIPPLTKERRTDLIKQISKMAEEKKVSLRHLRRDALETLKKMESDKKITEDDNKKGQDKIKKILDDYTLKIDDVIKVKEKEIMEV